jgi:hypothetical protein
MKPMDQIQTFLKWFSHQGVNAFDIYVRKPKSSKEDYKTGKWIWLNYNENVSADYIQNKLMMWIKYENAKGSDIYFRPYRDGKHAVIFLDDVPCDKALNVAKKYTACVVETSCNNTQIWLAIDKPLDKNDRKLAQRFLKNKGYTDSGSISGDHLGRLCGVKSQKHASWVNLIKTSIVKPYFPVFENDESHLFPPTENIISVYNTEKMNKQKIEDKIGGQCALKIIPAGNDTSASGKEYGWVLGMLRNGIDHVRIKEKLLHVATKRKKGNADKYVEYTLQKAINILNIKG